MAPPLNVIALISGGKDSFYSLLHCLENGHAVVAMGNLYPSAGDGDDQHDLNSFMYQTVGHTAIPMYEQALGIPLYQQPIVGTAVQTATSYSFPRDHHTPLPQLVGSGGREEVLPREAHPIIGLEEDEGEDETESLVPLLRKIMAKHPTANALSSGAILSTYQRTRIESIALRLGLVPLAYLWQYPVLPPGTPDSLLQDMQETGLDARIIKVASGGLDESFLWQNVTCEQTRRRLETAMKRFGTNDDGAVLGEGGEFETLVIDAPSRWFKGRIEVPEEHRQVVVEDGGSAWLRFQHAEVVTKDREAESTSEQVLLRLPELLDTTFAHALRALEDDDPLPTKFSSKQSRSLSKDVHTAPLQVDCDVANSSVMRLTFVAKASSPHGAFHQELSDLVTNIRMALCQRDLTPADIISTFIILRSMDDFATMNQIYSELVFHLNPPARVTISSGSSMPGDTNTVIHLSVLSTKASVKALHVQSRSYWAPANIGPYSQATSIPLRCDARNASAGFYTVSVAGQIPLIPHTMNLPQTSPSRDPFPLQAVLALQHLWRIGRAMGVSWWSGAVAYLPRNQLATTAARAVQASHVWAMLHQRRDPSLSTETDAGDLWEQKYYAGREMHSRPSAAKALPDWDVVDHAPNEYVVPPFFTAELEELPRGSAIEWHAHLGLVGGPIQSSTHMYANHEWVIHQCSFRTGVGVHVHVQTIISIPYSPHISHVRDNLAEVTNTLGLALPSFFTAHPHSESETENDSPSFFYLDSSISSPQTARAMSGLIPCRSLWSASGSRLAAVMVFLQR